MISPSLRHCGVAISRVIRVIFGWYSWITREIHGVFPEKIHHFDTENTCISRVILEYVSAGLRPSLGKRKLKVWIKGVIIDLARVCNSERRRCDAMTSPMQVNWHTRILTPFFRRCTDTRCMINNGSDIDNNVRRITVQCTTFRVACACLTPPPIPSTPLRALTQLQNRISTFSDDVKC